MNKLEDIITYVRRIIKSPSDAVISDNLIIDYINRFYLTDVDLRMQHFDLKTKYQFLTQPGVDQYNMPLYDAQNQPDGATPTGVDNQIASFPVYQGFLGPVFVNGYEVAFQTQKKSFFNRWPNIVQNLQAVAVGDGTVGPYQINIPIIGNFPPPVPLNPPFNGLLRGHVDMTGIIAIINNGGVNEDPPLVPAVPGFLVDGTTGEAIVPTANRFPAVYFTSQDGTGANVVVADSGQFLDTDVNYGILMKPGNNPYGDRALAGGYSTALNTINYFSGIANVTFPAAIPAGVNINAQCYFFQSGLPREILYYNNTLTLRSPPDRQYLVELDAYLTPAAFLVTGSAIPFGYMAEYIARGAARKILSDTGDVEQFMFYEPLFKEQELLVWKRSQRQWTANRTETIYSQGCGPSGYSGFNNFGGGNF